MARVRIIERKVVVTQNVVPQLAQEPLNGAVMLTAAGATAIPLTEFTVSGKSVSWSSIVAGYNLEVGDIVVADYEWEDGTGSGGSPPYDEESSSMNPVFVAYNMNVIVINTVPFLIHEPVPSTFILKVDGVVKVAGVDWTIVENVVTWISGDNLNVGDVVYVEYRRVV